MARRSFEVTFRLDAECDDVGANEAAGALEYRVGELIGSEMEKPVPFGVRSDVKPIEAYHVFVKAVR